MSLGEELKMAIGYAEVIAAAESETLVAMSHEAKQARQAWIKACWDFNRDMIEDSVLHDHEMDMDDWDKWNYHLLYLTFKRE